MELPQYQDTAKGSCHTCSWADAQIAPWKQCKLFHSKLCKDLNPDANCERWKLKVTPPTAWERTVDILKEFFW